MAFKGGREALPKRVRQQWHLPIYSTYRRAMPIYKVYALIYLMPDLWERAETCKVGKLHWEGVSYNVLGYPGVSVDLSRRIFFSNKSKCARCVGGGDRYCLAKQPLVSPHSP